jgi:chromosome segregation ATPase
MSSFITRQDRALATTIAHQRESIVQEHGLRLQLEAIKQDQKALEARLKGIEQQALKLITGVNELEHNEDVTEEQLLLLGRRLEQFNAQDKEMAAEKASVQRGYATATAKVKALNKAIIKSRSSEGARSEDEIQYYLNRIKKIRARYDDPEKQARALSIWCGQMMNPLYFTDSSDEES